MGRTVMIFSTRGREALRWQTQASLAWSRRPQVRVICFNDRDHGRLGAPVSGCAVSEILDSSSGVGQAAMGVVACWSMRAWTGCRHGRSAGPRRVRAVLTVLQARSSVSDLRDESPYVLCQRLRFVPTVR